jgi:hypothetical protein
MMSTMVVVAGIKESFLDAFVIRLCGSRKSLPFSISIRGENKQSMATKAAVTTAIIPEATILRLPTSYVDDPTALLYKARWDKHMQQLQQTASSRTIYGLCYYYDCRTNRRSFLVGCSHTGHIYVWKIPILSEDGSTLLEYDANPFLEFTVGGGSSRSRRCRQDEQDNHQETCCLYALKFINLDGINDLLLVSGDGGIYFFNWTKDVAPYLIREQDDTTSSRVMKKPGPLIVDIVQQFKPHASALDGGGGGRIEINDFAVDGPAHHLYGAAGDAFGCYKWNLERGDVVATYQPQRRKQQQQRGSSSNNNTSNSNSYLHTVNKTSDPHSILFGGEDGSLELWDTHADQRIDSWSMGTGGGGGGGNGDGWVSTSAIAGDWWHVGGGNGTTENGEESGFVASFHGPTRSLVTNRATTDVIQYLHYDEASTALYSVGNESFVSYWSDPCTLRQRRRVWCHTPSGFATAVSPSSTGLVAVAGEGSTVDLYENTSVPFCQFHCSS